MRKPASKEITSDSVEPCENDVCFSHIQLTGGFRKHTTFHLRSISNLQDRQQSQSLETVQSALLCGVSHMTILLEFTREMTVRNQSQALVHVVIARASLLTDHRISGPPLRANYRHFRTI